MSKNDGKFYLNIFENLLKGKMRFWLQIGLSPSGKDIYIFDPCLQKEVHFSVHRDGNVHIKNGKNNNKFSLFKNPWVTEPNPALLKQFIYFRPATTSYPIVDTLPSTLQTINHVFTFRDASTMEHTNYDNIIFKILLGPLTATTYKQHHRDINGDPDTFKNDQWIVGVKPMNLKPRPSHDTGTFVWFFNTNEEIPDSQLFSETENFEIGPASLTGQFVISRRTFKEGEVVSTYYRL